jgi:HD-like signal output (HDOD) protein
MKNRPVVVIVTGVLEPKIAKDMTTRGVDSIEFKPVNYPLFAAKVRGLVDGRKLHTNVETAERSSFPQVSESPRTVPSSIKIERTMVRKEDIEGKLTQLTRILPISGTAFDIFNMTNAETYDNNEIAIIVRRDATLSVDILRLANSAYYNYSSKKIVSLVKAISRIGQKRVGELALATSMMVALTPSVLPWMDIGLTWRRSMAAAVAIDYLAEKKGIPQKENRLFLSSITYPLGRVALCMLYPNKYQEMIKICHENHLSLKDQERLFFSLSPEEVMGFLLKAWNIPPFLFEPLVYSSQAYNAVASLGQPLAMKVELLKIAFIVGEIAVGKWESWDRIEPPPATLLDRLGIDSYGEIIAKTKRDYQDLINFRENIFQNEEPQDTEMAEQPPREVLYCNMATESFDFVGEILSRSGMILRNCDLTAIEPEDAVIVNCIGVPAHRLVAGLKSSQSNPNMLILTGAAQTDTYTRIGRVHSIPTSYSTLRAACHEILE